VAHNCAESLEALLVEGLSPPQEDSISVGQGRRHDDSFPDVAFAVGGPPAGKTNTHRIQGVGKPAVKLDTQGQADIERTVFAAVAEGRADALYDIGWRARARFPGAPVIGIENRSAQVEGLPWEAIHLEDGPRGK
jgi:hypothetical protein